MFCFKCGSNIPDNSEFCSKCGTKIGNNVPKESLYNNYFLLLSLLPIISLIFMGMPYLTTHLSFTNNIVYTGYQLIGTIHNGFEFPFTVGIINLLFIASNILLSISNYFVSKKSNNQCTLSIHHLFIEAFICIILSVLTIILLCIVANQSNYADVAQSSVSIGAYLNMLLSFVYIFSLFFIKKKND